MKMKLLFLTIVIVMFCMDKTFAQVSTCNAYFNYTYNPYFSQPELDIYQFHDTSTGVDSSTFYSWSFGTGDFSSLKNPGFTYEPDDSGFEQVCLTIHNLDSSCHSQYCDTIRVDNLCLGARYSYVMQGNTGIFKATICGQWDSIAWNFGDGSTAYGADSVVHTFATVDSYYVCMQVFISSVCQALYPCKSIECQQVYVSPTAVENVAADQRISTIPNPANSYIQIEAGQMEFPADVLITDITGNLLLHESMMSSQQRISVDGLSSGIYFVQVADALKQNVVSRFVKQ